MRLTRLFPAGAAPGETIELDVAASRDLLLDLYRPVAETWLRLNLITSVSGSAGGSDGTSETLTNPADRKLLGVIRELADVVLIGAESLRREGYLLPRRSRLAVVTGSGDLTGHRLTPEIETGRMLVLCPASALDAVRASMGSRAVEIVTVADSDGVLAMADVVAELRERGCASIVCEGGPRLAAQLVAAGLVDELCLSTSPTIGGTSLPLLVGAEVSTQSLALTQLLVDEASGLYARWAVTRAL